jgi:hypothetical protein
MLPGVVTYLPSWFPGAEFKRVAKAYRSTIQRFANEPHDWVKNQMVCCSHPVRCRVLTLCEHDERAGTALPSVSRMLLEEMESNQLYDEREEDIKWATASLFSGGADTVYAEIATFSSRR